MLGTATRGNFLDARSLGTVGGCGVSRAVTWKKPSVWQADGTREEQACSPLRHGCLLAWHSYLYKGRETLAFLFL